MFMKISFNPESATNHLYLFANQLHDVSSLSSHSAYIAEIVDNNGEDVRSYRRLFCWHVIDARTANRTSFLDINISNLNNVFKMHFKIYKIVQPLLRNSQRIKANFKKKLRH